MAVITVNLDDRLIAAADERARAMAREYGVKVSRSAVVNLALERLLGSIDRPKDTAPTDAEPIAA